MSGGGLLECYRTRIPGGYNPELTLSAYSFHHEYDGRYYYIPAARTLDTIIVQPSSGYMIFYGFRGRCSESRIQEARYRVGLNSTHRFFHRRARSDPLLKCMAANHNGLRLRSTSLWNAAAIAVSQQNRGFLAAWKSLYRLQRMGVTTILRRPDGKPVEVVTPLTPEALISRLTEDIASRSHIRTDDTQWLARRVSLLEKFFEGKLSTRRRNAVEKAIRKLGKTTGLGRFRVETLSRIALFILNHALGGKNIPRGPRLYSMLLKIKGVGPYTAGYISMLYERDYTHPPVDRWVAKLASKAYSVEEDREEVAKELSRRFGKYAGLAVFYLSIALDAQPIGKALKRLEKGELCPRNKGVTPLTLWRYNPEDWSLIHA